ncbi:MAG TPA: protein kinase, partial [Kofleriaceae bacterium]|nr:protein kinase [Kofleriaceae bacterium]
MEDESEIMVDPRIGGLVDERYKVLEAMASGSMGIVYKAERVPVGKLVAIKFLHAPFANDAEFLARFERETRVMSKLAHPNCVSVVDFGVWDGAPYLVMEYVSGTTLRALMDNGPLPVKRALALVRQIAAGLAHAHAQGVVHRDVKPANIMISEEIGTGDHVRILDFGLARLRGAVGRDATQTNVVVGTPNYMAPEQTVGGGLIDARTDIYAVGVVLFEMVCGERPFQADDTLALLGMHRAAPIPQLVDRMDRDTQLPPGLQDIVEKAMAKSPGDRFQSAIELAEAIDQVGGALLVGANGNTGEIAVRRSPEAMKSVATAPTVLDPSDAAEVIAPPVQRRATSRRSFRGALVSLAILLGGAGAAVWWFQLRSPGTKAVVDAPASPGTLITGGSAGTSAGSPSPAASEKAPAPGAGPREDGGPGHEPTGDARVVAVPADSGTERTERSDGAAEVGAGADIEMDPKTADDPAPASTKPSNEADEAANAPASAEEVEKHAPATPVLATTLPGAVQLIKDGKPDLALASLRALWKKTPNSAYIPFLLGNLYFDQRWWTVALDHYTAAIKKNADYRANPTLNRNVIRMLASNKTS